VPSLLVALVLHAAPIQAVTLYAVGGNAGPSGGQTGLYTVNAGTGSMTWIGSPHTVASYDNTIYNGGLAYDPYTDHLYALGCDSSVASALFLLNRTDASMVRLGYCYASHPGAFCSGGIAFDLLSRRLFALGDPGLWQGTGLFEINPVTGAATLIGQNLPNGTYLAGLGADPQTGVLYANGFSIFSSGESGLYVVDKGTGAATLVGLHGLSLGRQMRYSGLAVNPATGTMYSFGSFSASQNNLYTVSKSTGLATSVGPQSPNGVGVDGALVHVGTDILSAGAATQALAPLRASPNPARELVSFTFGLQQAGEVSLNLFDLSGRLVAALEQGRLESGPHSLSWSGTDPGRNRVATGLYFATLRADGVVIGRASVLVVR